MHSTYPSLRQLADQLSEMPEYAQLRAYIRGTISTALGETKRRNDDKVLTDKECVAHSLIAGWLDSNGYKIASQMMKTQMAEKYVENSEKYLIGSENIEHLVENLKIEVPKLDRKPLKTVENGQSFPKVDQIEQRRQPLKITPLSDEEFKKTMRERLELERARLGRLSNKMAVDVDHDDDSSDSSDSTSSSSDAEKPVSDPDEILTFSDILGKQNLAEKSSPTDNSEEFEFAKIPKAWGPSQMGLVTDDVATGSDPLPAIFNAHLPPLGKSRPSLAKESSTEIDALFGTDDTYDLDDFEEENEVGKGKNVATTVKKADKPVNLVTPVKKEEPKEEPKELPVEPLVLSEGESIDELEDFDTGLLSSGGSDYSF